MDPKWLTWVKKIQGIAQSGLHYTDNPFDRDRFHQLNELAAEILKEHSSIDASLHDIVDCFSAQEGYATPKVDVRGVVFRDDKLLLVKEAVDGKWTLPGGWADVAATPRENVEREVWEESGFEVKATRLLGVYDRSNIANIKPYPFHIYKIFISCEIIRGQATTSQETLDVKFFTEDEKPEMSEGRTSTYHFHKMFEYYKNPKLAVEFD